MNDSKNMNDMKALSINSLHERNIAGSYRNRLHNPSYRHNRSWKRPGKPPLTNRPPFGNQCFPISLKIEIAKWAKTFQGIVTILTTNQGDNRKNRWQLYSDKTGKKPIACCCYTSIKQWLAARAVAMSATLKRTEIKS